MVSKTTQGARFIAKIAMAVSFGLSLSTMPRLASAFTLSESNSFTHLSPPLAKKEEAAQANLSKAEALELINQLAFRSLNTLGCNYHDEVSRKLKERVSQKNISTHLSKAFMDDVFYDYNRTWCAKQSPSRTFQKSCIVRLDSVTSKMREQMVNSTTSHWDPNLLTNALGPLKAKCLLKKEDALSPKSIDLVASSRPFLSPQGTTQRAPQEGPLTVDPAANQAANQYVEHVLNHLGCGDRFSQSQMDQKALLEKAMLGINSLQMQRKADLFAERRFGRNTPTYQAIAAEYIDLMNLLIQGHTFRDPIILEKNRALETKARALNISCMASKPNLLQQLFRPHSPTSNLPPQRPPLQESGTTQISRKPMISYVPNATPLRVNLKRSGKVHTEPQVIFNECDNNARITAVSIRDTVEAETLHNRNDQRFETIPRPKTFDCEKRSVSAELMRFLEKNMMDCVAYSSGMQVRPVKIKFEHEGFLGNSKHDSSSYHSISRALDLSSIAFTDDQGRQRYYLYSYASEEERSQKKRGHKGTPMAKHQFDFWTKFRTCMNVRGGATVGCEDDEHHNHLHLSLPTRDLQKKGFKKK